jgi:hypothetical protein
MFSDADKIEWQKNLICDKEETQLEKKIFEQSHQMHNLILYLYV